MNIKKIFLLLIYLFSTLYFAGCNQSTETNKTTKADNNITKHEQPENLPESGFVDDFSTGISTIAEGLTTYGLFDENNNIIDPGKTIKIVNDTLKNSIYFAQNLPERRDYLLILMVDYIQQDFISNGVEYRTYPFSLEGYESIEIHVELPIQKQANEFCYLIVTNPSIQHLSIEDDGGWDKLFETSDCFASRFLLNNREETYIFDKGYTEHNIEDQGTANTDCTLTKDIEGLTVMPMCESGDEVKLVLGNQEMSDAWAIVSFCNWEQVPITNDNELYKIIKLEKNKFISYSFVMPIVDYATPYQSFSFPLSKIDTDMQYGIVKPSFRTIINKKE